MPTKNQSNKETLDRLATSLKENGLTKAQHDKGQRAQEALKGDKVAKTRLNKWNDIGSVIVLIKAHYKSIGVNPNKGDFGNYCATYFSRLSAKNDIPAAQKLASYWEAFKEFNDSAHIPVGNPMVLFRNVKKHLKEIDADQDQYDLYGFKKPADSKSSTSGNSSSSDNDVTPQEIFTKSLDQCSNSELLDLVVTMIEKIKVRSIKNSTSFNGQDVLQVERAYNDLADIDVNIKRQVRSDKSTKQKSANKK